MSADVLTMRDVSNTSARRRVVLGKSAEFKPSVVLPSNLVIAKALAQEVQHQSMTIAETVVDPLRAIDASDYKMLLHLASAKRKQGEVGLADQLFERGLDVMRREERSLFARLLGGGISRAEAEARVEWGRMLEDNGLYDRALAAYGESGTSDALVERRLDLLMRLGRLSEAFRTAEAARRPGMAQSACQAQRLVCAGLVEQPFAVPAATEATLRFGAGQMVAALEAEESKKDLLLQTAEHMRRAACMLRSASPEQLEEQAETLSSAPLRRNLLQLAAAMRSGELARAVDRVASGIAGRERNDWRSTLCLATARPAQAAALLAQAAQQCHAAQRWKLWQDAGLAWSGDADAGRALMLRALSEAPEKHRPALLCEAARREADPVARQILAKCVRESGHWKAGLELSVLLMRDGQREEAFTAIKDALASNPLIGRLWATLARWAEEDAEQRDAVLAAALRLVPRSGELWVERGRALARAGAWRELESCWSSALVFTPQYGDLFVEMLRASLWRRFASRFGLSARRGEAGSTAVAEELRAWNTEPVEQLCVLAHPNHGLVWDRVLARLGGDSCCLVIQVLAAAKKEMADALLAAASHELLHDVLFGME